MFDVGVISPYWTEPDAALIRNAGGRDPLGMLPVWSKVGRRLVPYLASPVYQVDGIKAVLLIQWLLQACVVPASKTRGFYRLMEGMVEYWLWKNKQENICFGSQRLAAEQDDFEVDASSQSTAVNGLYQYYRGTCRRAGFVSDAWEPRKDIAAQFRRIWQRADLAALQKQLGAAIDSAEGALRPARVLALSTKLDRCLAATFDKSFLSEVLNETLLGDADRCELAGKVRALRDAGHKQVEELVPLLDFPSLRQGLDDIGRCERFLLVLQDVFDLLCQADGRSVDAAADEITEHYGRICQVAADFLLLDHQAPSGRLRQLLELAAALARKPANARPALVFFIQGLADYHRTCMTERGRDPLLVVEGQSLVTLIPGERAPEEAHARLRTGSPWMNDYYLPTAAAIHGQLFVTTA